MKPSLRECLIEHRVAAVDYAGALELIAKTLPLKSPYNRHIESCLMKHAAKFAEINLELKGHLEEALELEEGKITPHMLSLLINRKILNQGEEEEGYEGT